MKRGTSRHPKLYALCRALSIGRRDAVGLLELLWEYTAEYAPTGDIGKFADGDIAAAVEWTGNTGELILGLVRSGWLDESDQHRLLVHDWADHAPEFVKKRLAYRKTPFAENGGDSPPIGANLPPTQPNPTKPNQTKPKKETADECRERQATDLAALYWKTISSQGSKSQAKTNCAKLLKVVAFDDLKVAVERLGADVKKHPWEFEYRASNFFGRKAYYKDFIGDAYESREAPKRIGCAEPPDPMADVPIHHAGDGR